MGAGLSMNTQESIHAALCHFAETIKNKFTQVTTGEPEDQLRSPFEVLMGEVAQALGWSLVCKGEVRLPNRLGTPDYAIVLNRLLAGYVELKAPGMGVNPKRFTGHNQDQWKRFQAIPNLLYSDGNEWALFRDGQRVGKAVRLAGDVTTDGSQAIGPEDVRRIEGLLRDFLSWEPIIPMDSKGKIDLKGFAGLLAPLCRMLRDDVNEALRNDDSPLVHIAKDWRQLLFPDASNEQFADAYAQTVTFALLLARSEGANPVTLESAVSALSSQHNLLSRALQVLTDQDGRIEIAASLDLLVRLITAVPITGLTGSNDPWLYFYEDFLTAYDPELRKNAGAYYTPVEVVHAQVRLVDDLLTNRLRKSFGFANEDVVTLDPATGTGTYLLGVIEHALDRIETEYGQGAVPGKASLLATSLFGFELMVGPYAVTELRVSQALRDWGALLPKLGTNIYLTDTLESPNTVPPPLPFLLKSLAEQHARAIKVKKNVPVIVCIGNPPYDRHEATSETNRARTGGWIRWGDDGGSDHPIFDDFRDPAIEAGHGVHLKNLYNLYVYFWRWALWKVFEQDPSNGQGVVSFISAASYLNGDAFVGMREHMRRMCDEIWIIDLGGEGRGTRKTENVFAIQTPVAIAVLLNTGKTTREKPAKVHYTRIEGTRLEKLKQLNSIRSFRSLKWQTCSTEWQAPFSPEGKGEYFKWPLLTDLMPWQHSGVELKRTWPVSPDQSTLDKRWKMLLSLSDRATAFRDSGDRRDTGTYRVALLGFMDSRPIADLPRGTSTPPVSRYAYRSFDREFLIADGRLISRPRPVLWCAHGPKQTYLTTLLNHPLGGGPAVTACCKIPDRHHLRGSYGGKDVLPLFRDGKAHYPNLLPGLLDLLGKTYHHKVTPEDFAAYVYGILAQPEFTKRYAEELETREIRVPLTKNKELFRKVRDTGARLLWMHTYGERFDSKDRKRGHVPHGKARCLKAVPGDLEGYPESFKYNEATQTLHVGAGEFSPVTPEVYDFEVSGLKVVQSWLKYRMKKGAGKKSSPLDDIRPEQWTSQFTDELLELLWVLEATVKGYPDQALLLDAVVEGPCFEAEELPSVPEDCRKPLQPMADDHYYEDL